MSSKSPPADHHPKTRILATGSSALGVSAKFRDTLTGRKAEVWLTSMNAADLVDFGDTELTHRLLHGGLPVFYLSPSVPEQDLQEWMDGYWAKDIQELFRLERRQSFQRFAELILARSGGIFTANVFARECGVSHTTIANYLAVLEDTFVAHVVRPFSSRPSTEIVAAPKVYGFDTGFVCYHRGWHALRSDDLGLLWERPQRAPRALADAGAAVLARQAGPRDRFRLATARCRTRRHRVQVERLGLRCRGPARVPRALPEGTEPRRTREFAWIAGTA